MTEPIKLVFGKHLPDQPALNNPGTPFLRNVVPANGFFRPFGDLNPYSNNLDARAQGAISGRDTTGNVFSFAGNATKLYKLTDQTFTDVSGISAPYATPAGGAWEFILWSDDQLIAINGVDAPQVKDPQDGSAFIDLTGSPPAARHGAVVRSFVFLGNWAGNENKVAWSAIDNSGEWNTDGTNQSDQQFLPSGGSIMRILGGEVALVFTQSAIHRFTYVGSPVIFQRDEIGPGVGLIAPGAAAQFGNLVFFIGQNSFYRMDLNGVPTPIGESRWNKTFFSEFDENNADKVTSAIDPINTIWLVAYPTTASATGLPDRIFLYNWATDDCSFIDIDTEIILSAFLPGTPLEALGNNLDALAFSLDSRVWQGGSLVLGGFDRTHMLGFFSGAPLEAEIETAERDNQGRRLFVGGARPFVDAADVEIAIKTRERQSDPAVLGAYAAGAGSAWGFIMKWLLPRELKALTLQIQHLNEQIAEMKPEIEEYRRLKQRALEKELKEKNLLTDRGT